MSTEATGGSEHFATKFRDNVDFFEFTTTAFNHFDDGGTFCADTADSSFYIAASVIVSVSAEDAGPDCKFGVGAVGA